MHALEKLLHTITLKGEICLSSAVLTDKKVVAIATIT